MALLAMKKKISKRANGKYKCTIVVSLYIYMQTESIS